jgi:hypothetical protein
MSRLKAMFGAPMVEIFMVEEIFMVLKENLTNPLTLSLLLNHNIYPVTHRIRKYVLNGVADEVLRLKKSYKDTFAMEAVAVSPLVSINRSLIIHITYM